MSRAGQILLSTAVEQYLDLRRGRYAESTVQVDVYVLRRFIRGVGDVQVRHVRAEKVDAWLAATLRPHRTADGLDRSPVTPRTYNHLRARVLVFWRWCNARSMTSGDWLMHTPVLKVPRTERLRVRDEVMWQMLDSLDDEPRDRALLALAINTGVRSGEAKLLTVGDVDLEARTLRLWISKSQIEDVMAVTDHLAEELSRWLEHYRRDVVAHQARALSAEDHLFPAKRQPRITGRYKDAAGVMRSTVVSRGYNPAGSIRSPADVVKRALRAVGLPTKGEGLHTIRRSVARMTFDALNEDHSHDHALRTVGALLHHANASTTEGYLGLTTETRKRDEYLRTRGVLAPRAGIGDAEVVSLRR